MNADWIRDIPIDWETRKLKYISEIDTCGLFGNEYSGDVSAKLATTAHLSMNGKWNLDKMEERFFSNNEFDKFSTKKGDIIVVKASGSSTNVVTGKAGYISDKEAGIVFSNFLLRIRTKKIVESKFLYYFLVSHITRMRIELMVSSTTYPNLKVWEYISSLILLPPIKTQKIIVNFLDNKINKIDKVICKKRELVRSLNAKREAIISKAVVSGINAKNKMKPSGIEWIGDVPENWQIVPLIGIFSENKRKNKNGREKNLLSLSYGNIIRKNIDGNFGLLPASFNNYQVVSDGDIILRLTDLQNDKKSLRVGLVQESGIITSAYTGLVMKERMSKKYIYNLLHSYDIKKVFYNLGDGVRQSMNFDDLKMLPIIKPPLEEQESIVNFLEKQTGRINKTIDITQRQISKLEEYRASLIYNAVTGKIKI